MLKKLSDKSVRIVALENNISRLKDITKNEGFGKERLKIGLFVTKREGMGMGDWPDWSLNTDETVMKAIIKFLLAELEAQLAIETRELRKLCAEFSDK